MAPCLNPDFCSKGGRHLLQDCTSTDWEVRKRLREEHHSTKRSRKQRVKTQDTVCWAWTRRLTQMHTLLYSFAEGKIHTEVLSDQ